MALGIFRRALTAKALIAKKRREYARWLVEANKREAIRNKPRWTRCKKCGYRVKGANHDNGDHHKTGRRVAARS